MELLGDRDPPRYRMSTVVHAKMNIHEPGFGHPEHKVMPVRDAHVRDHSSPAAPVYSTPGALPHLPLHGLMIP